MFKEKVLADAFLIDSLPLFSIISRASYRVERLKKNLRCGGGGNKKMKECGVGLRISFIYWDRLYCLWTDFNIWGQGLLFVYTKTILIAHSYGMSLLFGDTEKPITLTLLFLTCHLPHGWHLLHQIFL
jgi:hypothetical protein